jgi:hypothetical protein
MCPHAAIYVSSYCYLCPHAAIYVLILLCMCPHAAIYVSSHCDLCPHAAIYVLILLYMCMQHVQSARRAAVCARGTATQRERNKGRSGCCVKRCATSVVGAAERCGGGGEVAHSERCRPQRGGCDAHSSGSTRAQVLSLLALLVQK